LFVVYLALAIADKMMPNHEISNDLRIFLDRQAYYTAHMSTLDANSHRLEKCFTKI